MNTDQASALIADTAAELRRCCADLDAAEHCRLVDSLKREPSRAAQCRAIAGIIRACREAARDFDVQIELGHWYGEMMDIAETADLAEDEAKREEHFSKQRELRRRRGEIV